MWSIPRPKHSASKLSDVSTSESATWKLAMSGSLEIFFSLSPHSSGSGRSRRYLVDKSFRFDQKDPLVASVSHFSFLYSTVQGQIRKEVSAKIGEVWLSLKRWLSRKRWWAWKVKGQPVMALRCEISEERKALRSQRQPCGTTFGRIWSTTSPGSARRIEQGNVRCKWTKFRKNWL